MINPVLFDRRQLMAGATVVAASALAAPAGAWAQAASTGNEGTVRPGQARAINIAIPEFVPGGGGDAEIARQIPQVIANNLRRSGLFSPVDPRNHPERVVSFDSMPNLPQWRAQAAEALVTGRATRQGDGRIRAEFRLFDTAQGQQIAGQQYFASADNWRRIAHIISDAIYKRMTGEDGYFDTRIVFVDETGPKDNRRKRLAIMDQDGANVRYLTFGNDLVLTPRFSPNSQDITYMSFGQQTPRVFLFNIETGQREVVGNFQGMTFSPRFSPDGQRIVMSLSRGGDSNIFVMDLRSRGTQQLTSGASIDTSPSYSPDGRQICFESDRGGGQQIYVMGADGGGVRRISFGQGRYSTPVWSPRGDLIAFTRQAGGQFGVGVIRPDGTGERILTESAAVTEGPTFAPNGRVIMAFRDPGGAGGPHLFTVDITGRNEQRVPTPAFASDPAWSPLLSQT